MFGAYQYLETSNIKFEDTSMSYRIEAPGSGVTLVGTLSPFIDRGNMFEVLVMSFSKTLPDRQYIDMKMKHTIDAYALKKLFGKDTVFKYHSTYLIEDTSMSYRIEAPGSGVTLVGTLSPFIDKGNMFEILVMSFSKTLPDRQYIDMKMKHTIDAYALKKLFGKDTVFKYHSTYLNQDLYTFRKEKDFKRLETSITNIGKAIENNLIYPRESHACSTCLCKGLCKAWTGKEHENEVK